MIKLGYSNNKKNLAFYFRVDPEIENFFKTEEINHSQKWLNCNQESLKFYGLSGGAKILREEVVNQFGYTLYVSSYGYNFFDCRNISFLRTIGITNGVEIRFKEGFNWENLRLQTSLNMYINNVKMTLKFIIPKIRGIMNR